ncbi:MAG: M20/M25/M40 family metallo-hydrolase [bacterium]
MTKKINILLIFLLILSSCGKHSNDLNTIIDSVTKNEMQSTLEFLSLDLLKGRAPGTRGGELAEQYMKSVYKLLDFEPYQGNYFHPFILKGYSIHDLSLSLNRIPCKLHKDVMGSYTREQKQFTINGGVVFAGFGIISEDWNWNDYKGVSVKDKFVIIRVNEPGPENPDLFKGSALTYYGRWTYKIEEAARQGARGILLIHTKESAGYGWEVVQNSWGGEELYLPSMVDNNLAFRGWIREEKLQSILSENKISLDRLYRQSEKRNFKPVDLDLSIQIKGTNSFRTLKTRNVVGVIPGNHNKLKEKAVILSAHIDHLGMDPALKGDAIFNGAIDNAAAVAAMMTTAKILKKYQQNLEYSIIVLACQAEESGLLGSRYFASTLDPENIIANINFESTPVWEKSRDIMAVGAKYSSLEDIIKKIAEKQNLDYSYFSMSNQGFFYRSDQFSFARQGIPSIWISAGEDFVSGENKIKEFFLGNYHTVKDEYNPDWPLESLKQTVTMSVLLVDYLNRYTPEITWKGKMTFPVENK